MPRKLLVVDDEPSIVKGLRFSLQQDGYEVEIAYDGQEALEKFEQGTYDLIVLDVMLPRMDGMQVCQRVRESSDIPIIMLTAKGEDMDKILGLEYGADDYMTKPFNILELKARIKTILRRASAQGGAAPPSREEQHIITVQDMRINTDNRSVNIGGREINLTAKEFDLLQLFAANPGKVFSRENLLEIIWKYDYLGDLRTVDVHIRRLREKVEKDPSRPQFIFTKWGVGYYFTDKVH
nr:response regulator transcription factor [Maliibacterium massiliense]